MVKSLLSSMSYEFTDSLNTRSCSKSKNVNIKKLWEIRFITKQAIQVAHWQKKNLKRKGQRLLILLRNENMNQKPVETTKKVK